MNDFTRQDPPANAPEKETLATMPTKRATSHERDDQGGEPPCFMCLLDEDGLMPDRRDTTNTRRHAQNDAHPAAHDPLARQCGPDEDTSTYEANATA